MGVVAPLRSITPQTSAQPASLEVKTAPTSPRTIAARPVARHTTALSERCVAVPRQGLYRLPRIADILFCREGLLVYADEALDVEGLKLSSEFRPFRLGEL